MYLMLLPIATAATAAISLPDAKPDTLLPGYSEPAQKRASVEEAVEAFACRQAVEQVRDTSKQPELDRRPANKSDALMIAAVDKRIDDCSVMQMHGNVNDLRPIPQPSSAPARLQPAR